MSITIDADTNTISANGTPLTFFSNSIKIPSGNTQQRPQNPVMGMIRFNTQIVELEGYNGNVWGNIKVNLI